MGALVIGARFNGPDGSANGGYACGVVAALVGGPARVRLHRPPPLELALDVGSGEQPGSVVVRRGELVVATAAPGRPVDPVPPAPSVAQARAARARYRGRHRHIYPRCFVCGPKRAPGDGLCLFTGPVSGGQGCVACDFLPGDDLRDADGHLAPAYVWAALDCPSYFGLDVAPERRFLLGEMTAALEPEIPAEGPLVVYGWRRGQQRRKHFAAAALADAAGRVWARAEHVWIELAPTS